MKTCIKCGNPLPCKEHTSIIDEKTGTIITPDDTDEKTKQRIRDLRDVLSDL